MVLRLVLDLARRKWRLIAFATFQLYLFDKMFRQLLPSADLWSMPMATAAYLSIPAAVMTQVRVLYQLPLSRRTFWLTRWWLATIVAPSISLVAQLLARLSMGRPLQTGEQVVLYALFCVLYCGCIMTLQATSFGQKGDGPATLASSVSFGPIVLSVVAFPFVLVRYLPHTFSAINAWSMLGMLAMAAFSACGYMHQPPTEARPSQRVARIDPARAGRGSSAPEHPAVTRPAPFADRLTGLTLPLWDLSRMYFVTYSSVLVIGIVSWSVTSFYTTVPALASVLRDADMLPFASRTAHVTEPITVGCLFFIAGFLDGWMVTNTRALRALPVSSSQIGCIPIAVGLLSATMLWVTFLWVHLMVLRAPLISVRPDLFVAFAAITALTQMLRMTLPGSGVVKGTLSIMGPLGIVWMAVGTASTFRPDIVQPAMFIGGLLTLAASFPLMRYAVTHSSRIYRPQLAHVRLGS